MFFLAFVFLFLVFAFFFVSSNLLFSLIMLEIITFLTLVVFCYFGSSFFISDYFLLVLFSVFVLEGVIGLSGLILLVFFSGSDYISSSSCLKI